MTTIAANLQAIRAEITQTAHIHRPAAEPIKLLAVSKNFCAEQVREAYQAGQTCFAENYLQEALDKIHALQGLPLEWHFIGPIQSNKTRAIAENFAWVHSVDRLKIAERLSAQRPENLPPLQICLQINISAETSKSGVPAAEAATLAKQIMQLPRLTLRGLMTVPAATNNSLEQHRAFASLRILRDELRIQGIPLDTLSMGMSHDYRAAINEGATLLRIGSAIFGQRNYL